jgi:hypothetical protein
MGTDILVQQHHLPKLSVESKCILLVIEKMEVCPQLVRGEAMGASSEDF